MRKTDIILIVSLFTLSILATVFFHFVNKSDDLKAHVYNDGVLVYTFKDLNVDEIFITQGVNGEVIIESKDGKIRVKKETSPNNICSKQGWSDSPAKPLICLPNKVVVEIVGKSKDDVDVIT